MIEIPRQFSLLAIGDKFMLSGNEQLNIKLSARKAAAYVSGATPFAVKPTQDVIQVVRDEPITYVIHRDEYMGSPITMEGFAGTYRELLEDLLGANDGGNRDEPLAAYAYGTGLDETEDARTISEFTALELETMIESANGDGQPYITVFGINERKVLIGGQQE